MEFLFGYGMFLAKAITIVLAILITVFGIFAVTRRGGDDEGGETVKIKKLNDRYDAMRDAIGATLRSKKDNKRERKERKKKLKEEKKAGPPEDQKRIFVLDFKGDTQASAVRGLRDEVTAIVSSARAGDQVFLRLESPGGAVHGYGLASSQLARFREHDVPLTVAVDKVAASGGYMMACVADHIIAAPFAVVGSIGVVAQLPNFHRYLKEKNIDVELFTAGQYKRSVTMFGDNTEEDREKMREDLEETHDLFKDFVGKYRPGLNLDKIANGDTWYGSQGLENGLVDEVRTSDDWLLDHSKTADIYSISCKKPPSIRSRLFKFLGKIESGSALSLPASGPRKTLIKASPGGDRLADGTSIHDL